MFYSLWNIVGRLLRLGQSEVCLSEVDEPKPLVDKSRLEIVSGDITTFEVDAIVNAANGSLLGGTGVDGAIHEAAGDELLAECRTLGGCLTGEAKITKGYRLPCKYVIHAVGPRVTELEPTENDKALLRSAYRNALVLADQNGCSTVAFSSISTGHYNFAPYLAAPIAIDTILEYVNSPENQNIEKVYMVCYTDYVRQCFDEAFEGM